MALGNPELSNSIENKELNHNTGEKPIKTTNNIEFIRAFTPSATKIGKIGLPRSSA